MWEWIHTWTFFNYLALAAFCIGLFGFLNSFISLKSRYKDWKAVRNKESLKKRLLEYEEMALNNRLYKYQPTRLLIDLLWEFNSFAMQLVVSISVMLFITWIMSFFSSFGINNFLSVLSGSFFVILHKLYKFTNLVSKTIDFYHFPFLLTTEAEKLITDAHKLGVISEIDIRTIQEMVKKKRMQDELKLKAENSQLFGK